MIPYLALSYRPDALFVDAGDTVLFLDPQALSAAAAELGERVEPAAIAAAQHPSKRAYQAHLSRGESHEDGWGVLVGDMLARAGVAPARVRELLPGLRRAHDDFYFWRTVPADLPGALARARAAGLRLGVISNSEGRLTSVLERVGLLSSFDLVVDSHLEGVAKPDPAIFLRALERLGVAAERSVYAGDIPEVDVEGARAVGMHGVLVDQPGHFAATPGLPRVASVGELIDALLALS